MNISEISGTMVSDPSTATNQIIVDTGDGLQRAVATSAVSGTIVSGDSIETTDCIVDTGSGLQRAIKTAGSGGGGSSTKYGVSIDNFLGDVDANGVLQAPSGTVRNLSFDGINGINSVTSGSNYNALYSFYYRFAGCQNIGDVTFPDLVNCRMTCFSHAFIYSSITSLSMPKFTNFTSGTGNDGYLCQGCESLKSVAFPSVVSSSTTNYNNSWFNSAFYGCTALENVDFSGLESITEYGMGFFSYAFNNCTSLKQAIIFPKLKVIKTQAFSGAFYRSGLEEQTFPVLDTLWDRGLQYAFQSCSSLRTLSFPALKSDSFSTYTNVFNSMLSGVNGCTVHFPSNLQSVIGSWSDVTAGFGGTNTTVLFDLPATE